MRIKNQNVFNVGKYWSLTGTNKQNVVDDIKNPTDHVGGGKGYGAKIWTFQARQASLQISSSQY